MNWNKRVALIVAMLAWAGLAWAEGSKREAQAGEASLPLSVYYERYGDNDFAGILMRPFEFNLNEAKTWWFHGLVDTRAGRAADEQNQLRGIGSFNLGLGVRYGNRHFLFTELGWDMLEVIANDLLTSQEDKDAGNNAVNVDWFFTIGAGWRVNTRWVLGVHSRYNDISGIRIRDTAAFYYGASVGYSY